MPDAGEDTEDMSPAEFASVRRRLYSETANDKCINFEIPVIDPLRIPLFEVDGASAVECGSWSTI